MFEREQREYIEQLEEPLGKIIEGEELIKRFKAEVDSELRRHRKRVLRRRVRHTWAKRLDISFRVLATVEAHIDDISRPVDRIGPNDFRPPPFADMKDLLLPVPE